MAKIAIVTRGSQHSLTRLALVAAILMERGHEVVVIEPERREGSDCSFDAVWIDELCPAPHGGDFGMEIRARPAPAMCEYKVDFDWKRERDYPTLKQGLRMPHIKGGRSATESLQSNRVSHYRHAADARGLRLLQEEVHQATEIQDAADAGGDHPGLDGRGRGRVCNSIQNEQEQERQSGQRLQRTSAAAAPITVFTATPRIMRTALSFGREPIGQTRNLQSVHV